MGSGAADLGRSFERLLTVGVVTLIPFFVSLAPLAIDGFRHEAGPLGVLSQMVQRLFPFSRGLIHAYWAPNVWALWTFADRILVKLLPRIPALRGLLPASFAARYNAAAASGFASASRGLVENITFGVLPEITPSTCFLLTLTCMSIYMVKLWQTPTYRSFLASVSLCGFASFLFGWHVHEKAIMLPLVPYTLLAAVDYAHFRTFVLLSTAGSCRCFRCSSRRKKDRSRLVIRLHGPWWCSARCRGVCLGRCSQTWGYWSIGGDAISVGVHGVAGVRLGGSSDGFARAHAVEAVDASMNLTMVHNLASQMSTAVPSQASKALPAPSADIAQIDTESLITANPTASISSIAESNDAESTALSVETRSP